MSVRPTEAEMAILAVLWDQGPATVRQIHAALAAERGSGYTTILKFLQIMLDKGLVSRDERERSHIYRAAVDRNAVQAALVADLAAKAFGGSTSELILHALHRGPTAPHELAAIRALLDELTAKGGR